MKIILVIIFFFLDISLALDVVSSKKEEDLLKLVYISDLNLYPTPLYNRREKGLLEKKHGLLVYESQAVLLDLIRQINLKIVPDIVVFGGDNISNLPPDKKADFKENIWGLFLDMISELKADVLITFGKNENDTQTTTELVNGLNTFGIKSESRWWSYKYKDYLLIGLDSNLFNSESKIGDEQISYLKQTLEKNKNKATLIFIHKSFLDSGGKLLKTKYAKEYLKIIKANPQVRLTASGGRYLNRISQLPGSIYLQSPSPIAYPCTFSYIELSPYKVKIESIEIPLKGIIKKAETYLLESDRAISLFPDSVKAIRKHVKGLYVDSKFEKSLRDLRNR